jgi:hypothetical protein
MRKIIKVQQQDDSLVHLTWMINNICPNRCSYCPEILHKGSNHNYEWANAKKFFEVLFDRYPTIHCSVSGGEASVSPFFREIVEIFYNAGHTIGVTSNAAKPATYWADISNFLAYICFSYHPEFPDEKFIEKITAACYNTRVTVRVMMHPQLWDQSLDMYLKLKEVDNIFVEPVKIQDWGVPDRTVFVYSEDQQQFFIDNYRVDKPLKLNRTVRVPEIDSIYFMDDGEAVKTANCVDFINSGMTNFNGYSCEVGLKSLFINFDGEIFLGNCMIGGPIGDINDPDNIKWPTTPVICNKNLCHCTSDVNINKRIL